MGRTRGAVWFGSPLQTIKGQAAEKPVLFLFIYLFILFPWLLFKAASLRTEILNPGGRLRAWVGGRLFVLVGFLANDCARAQAARGEDQGRCELRVRRWWNWAPGSGLVPGPKSEASSLSH